MPWKTCNSKHILRGLGKTEKNKNGRRLVMEAGKAYELTESEATEVIKRVGEPLAPVIKGKEGKGWLVKKGNSGVRASTKEEIAEAKK